MISELALLKAQDALRKRKVELRWKISAPAEERDILDCERILGVTFPHDVRKALLQADGIFIEERLPTEIPPYGGYGLSLTLLGLEAISEMTQELRSIGSELDLRCAPYLVALVDFQNGDYVTLDATPGRHRIFAAYSDESVCWDDCASIASSYNDLLNKVVDSMNRGNPAVYWQGDVEAVFRDF